MHAASAPDKSNTAAEVPLAPKTNMTVALQACCNAADGEESRPQWSDTELPAHVLTLTITWWLLYERITSGKPTLIKQVLAS